MKKLLYVSASVVALSIFCARADDAPAAAPAPAKKDHAAVPPAPKSEMKEMTLTGTISKQETKKEGKDKKDVVITVYSLACDDGTTVKLPTAKTTLKIEDFVGMKVKLTGVGADKTGHDGKKATFLQKITNIEKVTDQAPAK